MNLKVNRTAVATVVLSVILVSGPHFQPACFATATIPAQDAGQPAVAKRIGVIKSINGTAVILTPDSGPEVAVTVQPNARLLRVAPGEKDLKNATSIPLQELQVDYRVLLRGHSSAYDASLGGLEFIVISHSDREVRHEGERQDWQYRG